MLLDGKAALVTGASRGIGKAIALTLAAEGADIIVNYAGNAAAAQDTVSRITDLGRKAIAIKADVASEQEVNAMIKQTIAEFGRIDILVNNAGITRDNLLLRMKEEDWDAVLHTNLKGVFLCTKAVAKFMMKQREGKIVNLASIVGVTGNAGQANYAAAKAGVIAFTKSIAQELASRGIRVNAVAPGFITTDMTNVLSDEVKKEMAAKIPLARLGSPEDVAQAVLFLVSSLSDYITGQTINVNGGMSM